MREKITEFDKSWKRVIKIIDIWKNETLNPFCLKNCNCDCCDTEHKSLSEEQIRLIFSLSKDDSLSARKNRYGKNIIRKDRDGTFSTELCYGTPCPGFDKNTKLCKIHKNRLKPDYCDNFPFYYVKEDGKDLLEIASCPGTKNLCHQNIIDAAKKEGISVIYIFEDSQ